MQSNENKKENNHASKSSMHKFHGRGSNFSKDRHDKSFNKDGKKGFGNAPKRSFNKGKAGDRKTSFSKNPRNGSVKPSETKRNSFARLTAFRIIQDITVRGAYTALAINNVLNVNKLPDNDKRLVTNIVYTTIENIIKIDYCIAQFMERPNQEPVLRDVVRLSVAQLLFMDKIPDFAVINEAVNLIRLVSTVETWGGVVNGVLRNIVRNKGNIAWPKEGDENYLSVMYSMPQWLVTKLINTFGPDVAKQIIVYNKEDKRTCIRPNLMRTSITEFEKMLEAKHWDYQKGLVPNSYLIKHIDSVSNDKDYQKGLFSVQGQSSMLAAMAVDNKLGMMVLDACAAPGGKTFFMAERQNGTGRVYAWDIYPHRVELIRQQMYRLGPGNVRVAECNASWYREEMSEFFDRILIDAPCSNLGVLAEKPDLLMKLDEKSLDEITKLQAKILDNCAKYLKIGGVLVYSTCSILPEENDEQIKRFLQNNPNFSLVDYPDDFPKDILKYKGDIGINLYPHTSSLEGFYIARLIRNE